MKTLTERQDDMAKKNLAEDKNFRSSITEQFFGAGITGPEYITRTEAKDYLNSIVKLAAKENWIEMVIHGYLGKYSWTIKTIAGHLEALHHDIKLVRQRLIDTSETPPALNNNHPADAVLKLINTQYKDDGKDIKKDN